MSKIVTKIVGAVFVLCGTFLFCFATVDMTSDVRIAGPMNLWPPPLWIYLIADVVFALLAILGMKLMRLRCIHIGFLMSARVEAQAQARRTLKIVNFHLLFRTFKCYSF